MNLKVSLLLSLLALLFSSCESIYEDQGDCTVRYKLRFVYNRNLKWADAFPSEVNSVNLYAFGADGKFVKEFLGRGDALSKDDYLMDLELEPGDYTLVAWCGLENEGRQMESFTVPQPVAGVTTLEELTCSLNTLSNDDYPIYSDARLYFMYHGHMSVNLPDTQDGATHYYTMYLTKDTNHIRIILQQLSGEDMIPTEIGLSIEDSNGNYCYDNTPSGSDVVTYLPWYKTVGQAGVGKEQENGNTDLVYVNGVIADLSVPRMLADHKDDFFLTITNLTNGETIVSRVPVIQYALLSKEYYEMAYGHPMTEQEFLDREDEYVLTFFIDKSMKWIDSYILIHSWRIVLHEYEFNTGNN